MNEAQGMSFSNDTVNKNTESKDIHQPNDSNDKENLNNNNNNNNNNNMDIDMDECDNDQDTEMSKAMNAIQIEPNLNDSKIISELTALQKESNDILENNKFNQKIKKETNVWLNGLGELPEEKEDKQSNNNNNNNNNNASNDDKNINNNNNNNNNNQKSDSSENESKFNYDYLEKWVNDNTKNLASKKYELTFHPHRSFTYNTFDKYHINNTLNKKELKETLNKLQNHINSLEVNVMTEIHRLEIENDKKNKDDEKRLELEEEEENENKNVIEEDDKKDINNAPTNIKKKKKKKEIKFDLTKDPTKWIVPEWCVPIRADIRQFNFIKLAEIQIKLGGRLFDVIMMDPPWQLATSNPTRGVAIGYSQLDDNIISSLPIQILQSNGLLFIWVINAKYRMALQLFKKWGYKMIADIAWVKQTVNRRLANGHGFYLQHAKETCLIGLKGDLKKIPNLQSAAADVIYSERRGQSQKPEEIYEYIEQLVPKGYYLEIFGRRNNLRNCWVTIGNEL